MATATSRNPDNNLKRGFRKSVSDIEVVGDTIILDGLPPETPHCFVGVQFFANSSGSTPATPGAGAVVITVETVNNSPVLEAPPSNSIDATAPTTVSWDGNTLSVKAVPTGVTTATHYRLVWTGNVS